MIDKLISDKLAAYTKRDIETMVEREVFVELTRSVRVRIEAIVDAYVSQHAQDIAALVASKLTTDQQEVLPL